MEQVFTIILSIVMAASFLMVVSALLPGQVKNTRNYFDESHWRSFRMRIVYVLVFSAIIAGLITLTRSTGLDFLFVLPFSLMLVFAYGAVVGLTAATQSLGTRIFPEHSASKQIIYGTIVVVAAGLVPLLGWALLFPYLLISGFGGVAISLNDLRKARK